MPRKRLDPSAASSAWPNHQSMSMLKRRWIGLAWRKAAVMRRHQSPPATSWPRSPQSKMNSLLGVNPPDDCATSIR